LGNLLDQEEAGREKYGITDKEQKSRLAARRVK
jgi:hypothetical protein